jgi:hypothetical protein
LQNGGVGGLPTDLPKPLKTVQKKGKKASTVKNQVKV